MRESRDFGSQMEMQNFSETVKAARVELEGAAGFVSLLRSIEEGLAEGKSVDSEVAQGLYETAAKIAGAIVELRDEAAPRTLPAETEVQI